ncbi:MAG: hypothetical protein AB1665_00175 [Candidatus Thermoplasmatota archaeon]
MGGSPDSSTSPHTCPRCSRPVPNEGLCNECLAEQPPEKDPQERVREAMEYVQHEAQRGKRLGVDLGEIEDLLLGAKLMLDAGSYEDALRLINECGEMAGERILQYEMLMNSIRRSEKKIKDAEEYGGDVSEARTLLEAAQRALQESDYKRGISYAIRSADVAEKVRRQYDSWRVEVGTYLKEK